MSKDNSPQLRAHPIYEFSFFHKIHSESNEALTMFSVQDKIKSIVELEWECRCGVGV